MCDQGVYVLGVSVQGEGVVVYMSGVGGGGYMSGCAMSNNHPKHPITPKTKYFRLKYEMKYGQYLYFLHLNFP